MQERKKRRIVIASVLKPIDDTRMYEKMGKSLASFYEVHVAGYPSIHPPVDTSIHFHPGKPFPRLSFRRWLMGWAVLKKIWQLKPALLIVTTHELLPVAVVAKCIGCSTIYDVQENYFRNIRYTNAFPKAIRLWVALYVRIKEYIFSPFINHFLLAEKGYKQELSFPGKRATIVENKLKKPPTPIAARPKHIEQLHFIFTGTLAETTGIFLAIDLIDKLYHEDQSVQLTIVGYCAQPKTLEKIRSTIYNKPYISLKGGDTLVPHQTILQEIATASIGIISYPFNPATTHSIPTKLYEYLGYRVPILLINHASWVAICQRYAAAVVFDPASPDINYILNEIRSKEF
ncbi:MAG TPA: hypothetical protein VIN08_10750, partial [Ohtaekwangia sp.]|uniref:hypothetical protein n=1 Tax=Ohtaekwangia sp. TaxID=2066019 RepID=UPI002F95FC26